MKTAYVVVDCVETVHGMTEECGNASKLRKQFIVKYIFYSEGKKLIYFEEENRSQ